MFFRVDQYFVNTENASSHNNIAQSGREMFKVILEFVRKSLDPKWAFMGSYNRVLCKGVHHLEQRFSTFLCCGDPQP